MRKFCNLCEKDFPCSALLKTHMKTLHEQKAFCYADLVHNFKSDLITMKDMSSCNDCGSTSPMRSHFGQHIQTTHVWTDHKMPAVTVSSLFITEQDENLTTKVVVRRTEIRASPKIPIELWSNCHAVLEGTNDLTNNKSENWNAVSKITLPMKPSIWSVLRSIQVEEQHAKARYYESLGARSEEEDSRKRTMDRLAKFKKLRAIVESYGEIPIGDYITAPISLFNEVGVE